MDLQARKISFVQEFLRLKNEEIISGLESMLKKRKSEIYENELKPMSLDSFNKESSLKISLNPITSFRLVRGL